MDPERGAGCYDSYIFIPPIKVSGYDIVMGIIGCDTYLVQKMIRNGLILSDPALSITSKHKHDAGGSVEYIVAGTKKWRYRDKWDYISADRGEIFVLLKLTWLYLFHGIETELPKLSHIEDCEKISRKRFPHRLSAHLKFGVGSLTKRYILRAFRKLKGLKRRPNSS